MRRIVPILLLVTTAVAQPTEPTPPVDPKISLKISMVGNRYEFHIGEIIPIKLSFSSRGKDRYQLNEAHYDRSGRMEYEHFSVTPPEGAVDPLANYERGMGGGLTGFTFLTKKPWMIQLNLNEWLRFTKPGEYKLTVSSQRVEAVDPSSPHGTRPVTATSNQITLKILPVDQVWEKRVYDEAVATLKITTAGKAEDSEQSPAYHALETLRFLGTPEATRELANHLRGESPGRLDFICYIGLVSSPERAVAREALEQALADPDHPVDDTFLNALRIVEAKDEQKNLERLVAALPNKRGNALRVSLYAALNQVWVPVDKRLLPKETTQKLVNQLISMFDQLPADQQVWLLEVRWNEIKNPVLLPLLKRYAERDFSNVAREDYYNARQLTAWSLRRWFELDADGARPAIIHEITQPRPRFGADVLGILPDKALPEVDRALVDHFTVADEDASSNLASLIVRYATGAILPQIVEKLDSNIGKWPCAIQNALLAYVLRVDPKSARPRIEKAIVARGKKFTACNQRMLEEVSAIHYDPILEEIAIHSLDDSDPEVAANAADMLRQFGSAAAERALWRRYETWTKRWTGHESELMLASIENRNNLANDLQLGRNLIGVLATGRAWLTDQTKFERLSGMTKVPSLRHELDRYLKMWNGRPLRIILYSCAPRFDVGVVQYQVNSMEALKEKLSQFPSATEFVLPSSRADASTDAPCIAELRDYLTAHKMHFAEEKESHAD